MVEAEASNGSCFEVDPVVNFDDVILIKEFTELAIVLRRNAFACVRIRSTRMNVTTTLVGA